MLTAQTPLNKQFENYGFPAIVHRPYPIDLIKKEGYSPDVMVVVLEDSNLPKVAYKTGEKTDAGKTVVAEF